MRNGLRFVYHKIFTVMPLACRDRGRFRFQLSSFLETKQDTVLTTRRPQSERDSYQALGVLVESTIAQRLLGQRC